MKLEIGKSDYPFDSPFTAASIRGWRPNRNLPVEIVTLEEISRLYAAFSNNGIPSLSGIPNRIAFDSEKKRIWLHPAPNGEFELDLVRAAQKQAASAPVDGTLRMPEKKRGVPR